MFASPIGAGRLVRALLFACASAGGLGALAAGGRAATNGTSSTLISRSAFGLSVEYPLLERALGPGPCPSQALIGTFRGLGPPSLRIGGDSQDLAGPSLAYHYFIRPSFWTVLGCFARETKAQITVGLNFAEGTLADNRAMIAAAEQTIPAAQLSFSLGNEPDLYGISHVLPNGFTVPIFRHGTWSASVYARQWTRRRALLGAIRLEGPDLAGNGWRAPIARLLRSDPPDQIDAHSYPASACPIGPPGTPRRLLSRRASIGQINKLGWLLAAARAAHRPTVISESNSASCGGEPHVSDTPVASVWAVRFTMAALLAGFEQVRFHSDGTSYRGLNWSSQHLDLGGVDGRRPAGWMKELTGRAPMKSPGKPSLRRDVERLFWREIGKGLSSEDAALAVGASQAAGSRWFRERGGMPTFMLAQPSARYLSFEEREEIAMLKAQGAGVREIARRLGRAPSTISRELRRNAATRGGKLDYRASVAQWRGQTLVACRPKTAKLAANERLAASTSHERLSGRGSPAGRDGGAGARNGALEGAGTSRDARTAGGRGRGARSRSPTDWEIDFPDDEAMRISHEAIYQALYVQGRGALRRELTACLRSGRALRVPRARVRGRGKSFVTEQIMISERPAEAEDRAVPGHWEGDLILGTNQTAIGTLVERSTRFTIAASPTTDARPRRPNSEERAAARRAWS